MHRRKILRLVVSLYTILALSTGVWLLHTFSSSQPMVAAAVLGVSTEEATSVTTPVYPYPIDDTKEFINARHYVLYHADTGKIVAQSKTIDVVPIASITKLMTAYLTTLHGNLGDTVSITPQAARQIGSTMQLRAGEEVSIHTLLYGALLVSGNDAAHTLAEYIGGRLLQDPQASQEAKIARFIDEMNATAKQLNMSNTHYLDPAGLENGQSTTLDQAKLASIINKNQVLATIINTPEITLTDVSGRHTFALRNSNKLENEMDYPGSIGGKTGFTPDAGHCLIASASRNGVTLTAVILSTYDQGKAASAFEARRLLEYGFNHFAWR